MVNMLSYPKLMLEVAWQEHVQLPDPPPLYSQIRLRIGIGSWHDAAIPKRLECATQRASPLRLCMPCGRRDVRVRRLRPSVLWECMVARRVQCNVSRPPFRVRLSPRAGKYHSDSLYRARQPVNPDEVIRQRHQRVLGLCGRNRAKSRPTRVARDKSREISESRNMLRRRAIERKKPRPGDLGFSYNPGVATFRDSHFKWCGSDGLRNPARDTILSRRLITQIDG